MTPFKIKIKNILLLALIALAAMAEAKYSPKDSTNLSNYLKKCLAIQRSNIFKAESMLDSASKVIFRSDDNNFKGWAMMARTSVLVSQGEYDSAEKYAQLSKYYYQKVSDFAHILAVNTNLAALLYARSKHYKAYETIQENIKIFKQSKGLDSFILVVNFDYLARILNTQKNYHEALKYQFINAAYYKRIGKKHYNNLLLTYILIGTTYSDFGKKDSAIHYYNIVLKEAKKTEDNRLIINASTDLALVMYDLKRFEEAETYAALAKKYFDNYPDKRLMAYNQVISSKIACSLNKLQFAKQEAIFALKTGKEIKNLETQKDANEALYQVYKKLNRFDSATYYLENKMKIEDSLNIASKENLILELNGLYQNEKTTSELNSAKASILRKNLFLKKEKLKNQFTLLISIILISALGFIIYIQFIRRNFNKKMGEKRNKIEIIEAKLSGQEEERQRISKDLHDSVVNDLMTVLYRLKGNKNSLEGEIMHNKLVEINETIRRISQDLLPDKFKNETLEAILKDLIHTHVQAFSWDISLHFDIHEKELNLNLKMELIKITQELFNNVIKHSDANKLEISLRKWKDKIVYAFVENGEEYDFDAKAQGRGLKNILERVNKLNGEISFNRSENFNKVAITFFLHS